MHTGYTNFPNIYYGEEHIGGHDDIKVLLETPQIKEANTLSETKFLSYICNINNLKLV